jgi:hypothetical protein
METIGNKTAILFPICSICFHSADCLFPFRRLKSLILSAPDFPIRVTRHHDFIYRFYAFFESGLAPSSERFMRA